jgi:hypothetical protein
LPTTCSLSSASRAAAFDLACASLASSSAIPSSAAPELRFGEVQRRARLRVVEVRDDLSLP